jgi:hypothetical protein
MRGVSVRMGRPALRCLDGQRPHPVAAHRGRPGAASRTSSRPTHLCTGIMADVPDFIDWWGVVGSALHTVSRCISANGPPPTAELLFSHMGQTLLECILCLAPSVCQLQRIGLVHHGSTVGDPRPRTRSVDWYILKETALRVK